MPKGKPATKALARALYLDGVTPKNIAKEVGVSTSTVKNWIVDLPKHSKGTSGKPRGYAAQRVARLTGRDAEAIRNEMVAMEHAACFFCESFDFDDRGWFASCFHHDATGYIHRAHRACNAVNRHATGS